MIILHNNRFKSDVKLSVVWDISRGYGVFETLRTYGDRQVPLVKQHVDRLFSSAGKIGLKIKYSKNEVIEMVRRVVKKSFFKIQRVKILVFSKDLIVISVPVKISSNIYNGVSVKSVKMVRSLPEIKSVSYLPSFLAHEKAVKSGFFEAILVNDNGYVTEGAYSNLFWFEQDYLCTSGNGILPGIVRDIILKNSSFKVKFRNIKVAKLKSKREVFLTQSVNLIIPVIRIDGSKVGDGVVGFRTKKLMEDFAQWISS
jgi:branched-subunit amino acid aminotransferase/4-amino-4-deoxychorismate lyase